MTNMRYIKTILKYIKWHYSNAIYSVSKIWSNIFLFMPYYFSVKTLLYEFFTPWKREGDSYKKGMKISQFFGVFIINSLMRIVGIIARTLFIAIFALIAIIWIILYPLIIFFWLLLPLFIVGLFIIGLQLIISSIFI